MPIYYGYIGKDKTKVLYLYWLVNCY